MATKREQVFQALAAVVAGVGQGAGKPLVKINAKVPDTVPEVGRVVVSDDGHPDLPVEEFLSPYTAIWEWPVPVIVDVQAKDEAVRRAACDQILASIGAALDAADPTLGGLVDLVVPNPPTFEDRAAEGNAVPIRRAEFTITVTYASAGALA